ncbi:MAG: methyltransferase domain-containing protein [Alphaproteobacteria bacterium]|nr:methyltransferase domain-containing protein [Alphaproteobacteria bacterium]
MTGQVVLHVGCGPNRKEQMPPAFHGPEWREIRYDINPAVTPDIVGTITDMSAVATGSVDALYNSHVIEHLYAHEVPVALREFLRVLKADGFMVLTCPDLQSVGEQIATGKLLEPAYQSGAGPISAIDMLYGHRLPMARGNLFMAHRYGFTAASLGQHLTEAEFARTIAARSATYDLWAIATKQVISDEELYRLATTYMPRFSPWAGPPPV